MAPSATSGRLDFAARFDHDGPKVARHRLPSIRKSWWHASAAARQRGKERRGGVAVSVGLWWREGARRKRASNLTIYYVCTI
jgi:hypothetical protein